MHKQVGGLDADTGDTCQQTHHGMWFSVGCPLQTFKTFLLDAPDLVTDEPPSLHVPLEFGQSVGRDWLALGCAQCLQPLLCLSQLRIEAPDPEPDQCCFHTIDEPALLANQALALAAWSLGILLPKARNGSRLAMITLAPQPAHKGTLQELSVEPIRLSPPMFARHRHAQRVDHMRLNATCIEPSALARSRRGRPRRPRRCARPCVPTSPLHRA